LNLLDSEVPITMVFSHLVYGQEISCKEEEEEEEEKKPNLKNSPKKSPTLKTPTKRLSVGSEEENIDELLELEDE
jgi:hypothetical protein